MVNCLASTSLGKRFLLKVIVVNNLHSSGMLVLHREQL